MSKSIKIIKIVKFFFGSLIRSPSCPNCGDRVLLKRTGSIKYDSVTHGIVEPEKGALISIKSLQEGYVCSLIICSKCLSAPFTLNISQIIVSLEEFGWKKHNLKLVRQALRDFKEKNP